MSCPGFTGAGSSKQDRNGFQHRVLTKRKQVRAFIRLNETIARQRGRLFCWSAVCFGIGVGIYFALPVEPDVFMLSILTLICAVCLIAPFFCNETLSPPIAGAGLILAGVLVASAHARTSAAPVLSFRYYGPVEGRVIAVDRSLSGKIRMTLDQVVLHEVAPSRTPEKVRISLHGDADPDTESRFPGYSALGPEPGQHVVLTANLSPPPGPAEPGGFDFRRFAWFQKLGAIGYTRTPVLQIGPPRLNGFQVRINHLRGEISELVRARIPGEAGAFAATITTGDRSAMSVETTDALRASNLSHLLAISGLHMGLLTGFVFTSFRLFLALIPGVALRLPARKMAAVAAMITGAVYLALSGGNVATVRAFIMVSALFIAVLLGRKALTLNSVALAALIVLLITPEALPGPGFQMSFAATTALVFVFAGLQSTEINAWFPRWMRPVFAVLVSSFVAGAATAPIAAAHFNQVAQYGLLANVLSVPVMGALVVPAGVLAFLLEPLGLGWIGFLVMEVGINWILRVALFVSGLEGAVWKVPTPGPFVLPLITLGAIWFVLWNGRMRSAGILLFLVGFFIWSLVERPLILIAESGRMMGVLMPEGRAVVKARGDGFAARTWLENDGDTATQEEAAARSGFQDFGGFRGYRLAGQNIILLSGRGVQDRISDLCQPDNLMIYGGRMDGFPELTNCRFMSAADLRRRGSLAIYRQDEKGGGLRIISAEEAAGRRLWTSRPGRAQRSGLDQ